MFCRAHGACCAIAGIDRLRSKNQRIVLTLICMLLFQPTLHQFNFELLVGNDFLRQSPHSGSLPSKSSVFAISIAA